MAITSPALDPAQPTGLFLEGAFEERDEALEVRNPYSGETIAQVAVGGPEDVGAAVAAARGHLGAHSAADRAAVLERAAPPGVASAPRPSPARSASRPASR